MIGQPVVEKSPQWDKPYDVCCHIYEYGGERERSVLKGSPANIVPVGVSHKITQWKNGSEGEGRHPKPEELSRENEMGQQTENPSCERHEPW